MGVARDAYPREGDTWSFVAGFAEVEVDVETGEAHVSDYVAVADCGSVRNGPPTARTIGGVDARSASRAVRRTRPWRI